VLSHQTVLPRTRTWLCGGNLHKHLIDDDTTRTNTRSKTRRGRELASVLAGSWRQPPVAEEIPNEILTRLAPVVVAGGGAALTWFCIRHHKSKLSQSSTKLYREAYIGSVARAAAHEAEVVHLLGSLQVANIRSILLKGWSVGRLYPESGLRPSGDIDLWIDPDQRSKARVVLQRAGTGRQLVDLDHDQLSRFEDRGFADFYASCDTVHLGGTPINVLRQEDQIRILCLHFLKHGGWRPIWLCDIAVLLEFRNPAFNWELCLGSDSQCARWIGCTLALASDLLGAIIPPGAPRCVTSSPPGWFTNTVLTEWSNPSAPSATTFAFLIPELMSRPWKLRSILRGRWRNPIQATIDCNGAFDALPRMPYQLWNGVSRAGRMFSGFNQLLP
jgi:Uncharacterised nucleotidyltransferase